MTSLVEQFGDDRETVSARLEAKARAVYGELAHARRWTLFARLSWAAQVSEITASKLLEEWARSLRAAVPGSAILCGLHSDTDRRHAHALIFIPKRVANPLNPVGIVVAGYSWGPWLRLWWKHGEVNATHYSPGRKARRHGAAGEYVAKDVGTVMLFGSPPAYPPHWRRSA